VVNVSAIVSPAGRYMCMRNRVRAICHLEAAAANRGFSLGGLRLEGLAAYDDGYAAPTWTMHFGALPAFMILDPGFFAMML